MTWDEIKRWIRDRCPFWLLWLLDPILAFVDTIVDAWHRLEDAINEHFHFRLFWWGVEFNIKLGDFSYHFLLNLGKWKLDFDTHLGRWGVEFHVDLKSWEFSFHVRLGEFSVTFSAKLKDWEFLFHVRLGDFDLFFRANLRDWEFLFRVRLGDWGFQFYANLSEWDFIFRVWGEDWNATFHANLRDWEFSFRTWQSDREFDWGVWLEDRHQELIEFLYGEEGVVTGAINELKEWVEELLDKLIREVILYLMDWMGYVAPSVEELDDMAPHFSPFTDYLDAVAYEWRELKGVWAQDALATMEAFAAELRGEEEMELPTPSEIIFQYWQMLDIDTIRLILEPPIKG